jgi:hypothetical protein
MTDPVKRLNYFNGQFLREDDFLDEQSYHRGMRQLHNQTLHTYGIAGGLKLSFLSGATRVTVGQGSAIDGQGRELVLPNDFQTQDLSGFPGPSTLFVTVAYAETKTNETSEGGVTDSTRVEELPTINVAAAAPADASLTLILGRVAIDAKGVVQSIDNGTGANTRRTAGAVGGDLNVVSLTLADPGVASAQWPRFTATTSGRVDLAGSLKLAGGLDATQLHVATDMAVGPVNLPSYQGRFTASGTNAEISFTRRNLTAWPASPAAGDRYLWYTADGSQASLWTEVNGDLLTVTKTGDLITKGTINSGGGLTVTAGAVQVSGTGAKLDVNGPTFLHGGDFELRDAGTSDQTAVRLFSIGGNLYLQNGAGNNIIFRSRAAQANVFVQDDGKVGIGVSPPQAQLHVATDMAVGPVIVPSSQGRIMASGTAAEISFTRRNLTAWPTSAAAGDRYLWYTADGSQASLWTEVNGDLLTVTKTGDLITKGRIHSGAPSILYAQTSSGEHTTNSAAWTPVPDLTLTLPAGPGNAIIILNVPNPYAKGNNYPGGNFALLIDGIPSAQITAFTYNDLIPPSPGRVPATLVIVVPLKAAAQQIQAAWQNVRGSTVVIDTPASLTAIIA